MADEIKVDQIQPGFVSGAKLDPRVTDDIVRAHAGLKWLEKMTEANFLDLQEEVRRIDSRATYALVWALCGIGINTFLILLVAML